MVSKIGNIFQEKIWVGYSPTPYHNQPHKINPLSHFQPTPTYLNNITPNPKNLPTKTPTTIEISTFINPNPQTDPNPEHQNSPKPQNN